MGGLVFDFKDSFPSGSHSFATGIERLSLTPKGVKLLAECGHLPRISEREIADKSKTDELGKFLACIQATWMVVQVCTRLGLKLPVTILEVSAVSHVVCALILYGLWWYKPRKIGEPTVLKGDWTEPLAAFMMMSSQVGQQQMLPGFRVEGETSEISGLRFIADNGNLRAETDTEAVQQGITVENSAIQPISDQEGIPDGAVEREKDNHNPRHYRVRAKSGLPQLDHAELEDDLDRSDDNEQTRLTRSRWNLACQAIHRYPAVRRLLRRPFSESNLKYETALASYPEMPDIARQRSYDEKAAEAIHPWWECSSQHLVVAEAPDWPHDGLLRTTGGLVVGTILWISSIAFSAVYIAAWNADFPTYIEQILWRSSALYIAFSGLFWAFLHILAEISGWVWWTWYDVMSGKASKSVMITVTILCTICGIMYLFGRGFLLVEALLCLRSLPVAAYLVPQWTLGVPHVA